MLASVTCYLGSWVMTFAFPKHIIGQVGVFPLMFAALRYRLLRLWLGLQFLRLRARSRRAYSGNNIVVAGIFSKQCGLQRAADLMVMSFRKHGRPVTRCDITSLAGLNPTLKRTDTTPASALQLVEGTDIVIHAPPHITKMFLGLLGKKNYDNHCVIAYWHWETERAPQKWKSTAAMMDQIWVPTPFVCNALIGLDPGLAERVRIVPHDIGVDPFPATSPRSRRAARDRLGISHDAFVAGFTFSMGSCFARKNPIAAIEAFQLAFPPTKDDARFVMRCCDGEQFLPGLSALETKSKQDPRIVLIDVATNDLAIQTFYEAIDTLVSLHRSEGYGLTIAEAAQTGAKVICTDWGLAPELAAIPTIRTVGSGLLPIIDPQRLFKPNGKEVWAEPDTAAAARILEQDYREKRSLLQVVVNADREV